MSLYDRVAKQSLSENEIKLRRPSYQTSDIGWAARQAYWINGEVLRHFPDNLPPKIEKLRMDAVRAVEKLAIALSKIAPDE